LDCGVKHGGQGEGGDGRKFEFEEAVKTIERLKTSRPRGKVIVDIVI